MTKKHFNSLAEQLASVRPPGYARNDTDVQRWDMWVDSVLAVARACRQHNPAFNDRRFIAACRGE